MNVMILKHAAFASIACLAFAACACTKSQNKPVEVENQSLKPRTTVGSTPVVPAAQPQGQLATQPSQGVPPPAQDQTQALPPQQQNGTINTQPPASGNTLPGTGGQGTTPPPSGNTGTNPPPAGSTNPPPADNTNPPGGATNPPPAGTTNPPAGSTGAQDLGGGKTRLGGITVTAPAGYAVAQQGQAEGTVFVGYAKGGDYVAVYAKSGAGLTTQALFVNDAQVTAPEASQKLGKFDWKTISTSKTLGGGVPHAGTVYVTGFLMEEGGTSYYGYAKAETAAAAKAAAEAVLSGIE